MDKSEIKRRAKQMKLKPSDLFDKFDFREDPVTKEIIDREVEFELEYRDQKAGEELNKKMDKEIEENKLKTENNPFIPGPDPEDKPKEKREEKKKKAVDEDENPFIPDLDDEIGDSGGDENPLIPD